MTPESPKKRTREEILAQIASLDTLIAKEENVLRDRNVATELTQDNTQENKDTTHDTPSAPVLDSSKIHADTVASVTPPTQTLDEKLNEVERNARASISENIHNMADEALKGNKEEIDNATLRMNQYSTIKEGIEALTKKKKELIESGNLHNQDLIDQLNTQIESLNSLNPYKSPSDTKEEPLHIPEIPPVSPIPEKSKTINESYSSNEETVNDTFNPREKSVADAYEDGTLTPKEEGVEEKENSTKSQELIELENTRQEYAKRQKEFLDNKRKTQGSINKIRDFFGLGKKIKDEDLPNDILELKATYSQKKTLYGKSLIAQYFESIEEKVRNNEISEDQKDQELETFMRGELFDELIIKERESLLALQAETLPAKEKGILGKALDGYLKLKPWQRTVISSTLITGVIATTGAFTSAGAAGAYLGTKVVRGVASVYSAKKIGKGIDSLLEKDMSKDLMSREWNARFDMIDFDDFEKALTYAEDSYNKKLAFEQTSKRIRLVTKGAISLLAGLGTSEFIGQEILPNISLSNQPIVSDSLAHTSSPKITPDSPYTPVKVIPADSIKPLPDTAHTTPPPDAIKIGGENSQFEQQDTTSIKSPVSENLRDSTISPKDTTLADVPSQPKIPTPETPLDTAPQISTEGPVSVDADKLGAIETFKDLKEKLLHSYPDSKTAPANVREILEGDPTTLAIKYGFYNPTHGFYNPTQGAESAVMHQGEQLGIDTKGNLYFKDTNGTVDYLSENNRFDGKMIDTDNKETLLKTSPSHNIPKSVDPNEEIISTQKGGLTQSVDPNEFSQNTLPKSVDPNEVGFRQNTFYSKDPEIDGMTPQRPTSTTENISQTQTAPTTQELLKALDVKNIHSLAEQQVDKDIDGIFQKPNFLLGGSTPGTKTEEWLRTLKFMEEKKLTAHHLFEAQDANMLQNSKNGEFFTLGEYARSLKYDTGLEPKDGELLKDYLIRTQEYKIEHHITDKEMIDLVEEADKHKKIKISDATRQKIRARQSVDNDGVYN